ncbi:MAG: metallophosphoesterase [Vicinamibacteria bacterium]|nr:metallophosphoesterase [Vicinamibacteria bacterium]
MARLMVFSDPHYFAPSLWSQGEALEDYLAHDPKLLMESDAIMRALTDLVERENPQIVLVAGDLTKDGERVSHEGIADYLRQMKSGGRKVFVVPGNHDIQNANALSYAGTETREVPTVSAAEFASIYEDAGYGEAIARDPASLSYVAELAPGLWLLAIDSCIYGDTRGSSKHAGRLSASTRAWIESMLDEAKRSATTVVGMLHHGLIEHFTRQTLLFSDFVVDDHADVASLLLDGGVGAVFTGHFHANDITQFVVDGRKRPLFDIETGAAASYPCPYRIVDIAADTLIVITKYITAIDHDLGLAPDFQTYANDNQRLRLVPLTAELIQSPPYSLPAKRAAEIAPWLADGLVAHYLGDEAISPDVRAQIQSLFVSGRLVEQLAAVMLQSIWTDLPPADNDVTLDLAVQD